MFNEDDCNILLLLYWLSEVLQYLNYILIYLDMLDW